MEDGTIDPWAKGGLQENIPVTRDYLIRMLDVLEGIPTHSTWTIELSKKELVNFLREKIHCSKPHGWKPTAPTV